MSVRVSQLQQLIRRQQCCARLVRQQLQQRQPQAGLLESS